MAVIIFLVITFIVIVILIKNKINEKEHYRFINLEEVDNMPGIEFEHYTCEILKNEGYKAKVTPGSNDFGVDIIAEKDGYKIAVQVKRYSSKVPRTAISDAVAGMKHYNCSKAMVLTNNYFSDGALALAKSNNCELIDRDILSKWIYNLKKYNTKTISTENKNDLKSITNFLNADSFKSQFSKKINLEIEYKRLGNQIKDLEDDISDLESDIWDLKYDIRSIKSTIKVSEKKLNILNRDIASCYSEFGDDKEFYDSSDIKSLKVELQKALEEIKYNVHLLEEEEESLKSKKVQLVNSRKFLEELNSKYLKIEEQLYN